MRSRVPLGEFLCAYLHGLGVRDIFGIPGDLVLKLFARLDASRHWRMHTFSHEPAVGYAADGYARASHRLGVTCVTYGAGGNNMVNAVAGAYAEHVPVLVLSGGPGRAETSDGTLIHHQARAIDSQHRIYREVTAARALITESHGAADAIDRVVRTLWEEQRPGYIEIHRDMIDALIEVPPRLRRKAPLRWRRSDPARVEEAARDAAARLAKARRPIVLAGIETYRWGAEAEVLALVEKLGAPVLTTLLSKGAIPPDHPLHLGVYFGNEGPPAIRKRFREADLVLDLGTLPTDIGLFPKPLPPERRIRALDHRVDIGFHTYDQVELRDFAVALGTQKLRRHRETVVRHDNLPRKPAWLQRDRPTQRDRSRPLSVAEAIHVVNQFLSHHPEVAIVADSGDMLFAAADVVAHGSGAHFAQGFYASMGFAVPAAMGIEIASGRRPLVLLGDGAFQMTGPEIAHAPRNGTHPIVLVINNGGWNIFRPVVDNRKLLDIPPWPYAELGRLWGGYGRKVESGPALQEALGEAAARREFAIIEACVDPDDHSPLAKKYIRASSRR